MLAGIIKDLKNNITYNIYITSYKNKIDFSVKCIDMDKYYFLNKHEIKELLSKIFDYNKKYIGKYKDYDVYLDDEENKHYFKNGYENIELFFKNNGNNALLYNICNKKDDYNIPKSFIIKNTKKDIAFVLICSLIFLNSFYLGMNISDNKDSDITFNEYISSEVSSLYNYINLIDENEIIQKINETNGLTLEEKEYLINEDLFSDILKILDRSRNEILREKISNITKVYFTEEECIKNKEISGFYNALNPNILHIKDAKTKKETLSHEFIHLLQDDNNYYFIREAVAELMTHEYYKEPINSYSEEIKYAKILMEIIGPKPVLECCFKGDTSNFENSIKQLLTEEDSKELLNLFTTHPNIYENKDEVYKKIYDLLSKMYKGNILEDPIINTTLNYSHYINRGYFNKKYIEECNNKDSWIFQTINVEDAINKGLIEVECSATKIEKITLEQFLLEGGRERNISYSSLPNYFYKDKYVINTQTKKKYSLKDAINKGFIYDVEFFKISIIDNLTLEETIEYEKIKDHKGHISIINVDSNIIRHVFPPHFTHINNKDVAVVEVLIKKKFEPINKKFPEQFEEYNKYNNFKI